jgi:hypothetical protein
VFYCAEKFIEINNSELHSQLQKRSISLKHFAAPQLLTLFTSIYLENRPSAFISLVFSIALIDGWPGFFKVFSVMLDSMSSFIAVASMEDMIVMWDAVFRSEYASTLQGKLIIPDDMSDRVDARKICLISTRDIEDCMTNIACKVDACVGNRETVAVISEEFLAIHQKIKDILVRENITFKNIINEF